MHTPFISLGTLSIVLALGFVCNNNTFINAHDQQALIAVCLDVAFGRGKLPDCELLKANGVINVSSDNIEGMDLPPIRGLSFNRMSPAQLQSRADSIGDFYYLYVAPVSHTNGDTLEIRLINAVLLSKKSTEEEAIVLNGSGLIFRCFKTSGKWVAEVKEAWISEHLVRPSALTSG